MKTTTLILTVLFSLSVLLANANKHFEGDKPKPEMKKETYQKRDFLLIPYSPTKISLNCIAKKGVYKLYKSKSFSLNDIPGCTPVGENYRFFIFKNGKFHMTVTKCNQQDVFKYFTE